MKESPQEYSARISSYVSGEDHLKVMSQTPSKIAALLRGKPDRFLTRRPESDKWSVAEILAHLTEGEIVIAYRLRMVVATPGAPIQAYDQDVWQNNAGYLQKAPRETLKLFTALRSMNVRFLKSLKGDMLDRFGIHSERGEESIRRMMELYAGHDVNHVSQIKAIMKQGPGVRSK
ncbi:MAG TPA: DinB family protein [Bacteroidota bacterium]